MKYRNVYASYTHFRAVSTVDMVQAYPDFLVISFFFHVVHF